MFHIYITVWKKAHFKPYEVELKSKYPECYIDYNATDGTRIFMHIATLSPDNVDAIISRLSEIYYSIKEIADHHK